MLGSVRLERHMEVSTTAKARGRLLIENCCFDVLGLYSGQKVGAIIYRGDLASTTVPLNKSLCFTSKEMGILSFRTLD